MNDAFIRALLVGRSRHGKTTSLFYLAQKLIEQDGRIVRVVNSDSGSNLWWENTKMFKDGKVKICYPASYEHKIAVMKEIANGYWPIGKKKSKVMDDQRDQAIFVDGMSATARMLLRHMANHEELVGKKHALAPAGVFYDGDLRIAVNSQAHYNVVHQGLEELVIAMCSLPLHMVWTALQTEGTTDDEVEIYGPKTVGKAITTEVTTWFNDTWHQERFQRKNGSVGYRVWFEQHMDRKMGREHLCGIRIDPERMLKLKETVGRSWISVDKENGLHWYYLNWLKGIE